MDEAKPLTPEEVARLQARLRERRAELAAAVDARLHGHGPDRHAEAGLPRRAEETDDDAAAEAERHADALARVTAGSYGECADCGEAIGIARLTANPAAERCATCQEIFEKRRGLLRGARA
ncbi:MAG: TraR/DksA C4-type zinc finger protein [Burkholderiaceae bacterium]|nr:TraR/DksA C4-type zinc finger protein [Burkholderiaceae bacterium]